MFRLTAPARLRFLSNLAATTAGAVLGVCALTLAPGPVRWLGLGIGAGVLLLALGGAAAPGRGWTQRVLDLGLAGLGVWAIVAGRVLSLATNGATPATVRWLGCSAGAAITGLALLGLVLHELAVERDLRWAAQRLWAAAPRARELDGVDLEFADPRLPDPVRG